MKNRKLVLHVLLSVFCLAAIALPAAPAQASSAYITLTPSSGPPGESVVVKGYEFDAYEEGIYVLFGDLTIDTNIVADADGYWQTSFAVPLKSPGEYSVTAEGETNTAVTEFRIKPLLTISSTAGGSVTVPGEGAFTYDEGTEVNLVAEAEEGCQFNNWTGDVTNIANVFSASTTITMNDHYSITANFECTIYVECAVSPNPTEVGQETLFMAAASGGVPPYQWSWTIDWTEIATTQNTAHIFAIDGKYGVRVYVTDSLDNQAECYLIVFVNPAPSEQYHLTISSTTGGSVTTPGEGTSIRNAGSVVDLAATPLSGYLFVNWTGDVDTIADVNAATTTITMNDHYSITANFVRLYDLTISSTTGGSVTTPGQGTSSYDEGTVVDLVASPTSGYLFVNWTGDVDTIADANAATTTITMDDNYSITANFELIMPVQYFLTISSTTGGSVTTPGQGTSSYDGGTVVDLVASPDVGYDFVNWTGDVDTIADVSAATTTIIMQCDYEITARFLASVVDAKTETVTDDTVDARDEADTEVKVDGTATVTVAQYEDNPGGTPPTGFNSLDKYIDVYVPDTTEATELEIRLYYTDAELDAAGIDEESLRLFWWDGDDWVACSDSGVNTASNYIWAIITEATTPRLDQLQGTAWGGYGHPSTPPQACGCFIATAAYGTDTAKEIDILREFRDVVLLPNSLGAGFVSLYYEISPSTANFISQHEVLRTVVRLVFVDPIVAILNWSHALWSAKGSR